MWNYYLALALRSSARSKALTALVIVLLGVGVAACMVSYAVFRATTNDPVPSRSAHLYVPQVDNFGPSYTWQNEPPYTLSYTDALALWRARKARRQTILYPASWQVESDHGAIPAMRMNGDAVTTDFFAMFDVPFRFGSSWTAAEDEQGATVVVISRRLNDTLFAGQSSIGQTMRLDGHIFRIVGVLDRWNPKPRFFDLGTLFNGAFDDAGDIYIPFARGIAMQKDATNYNGCPTASGVYDSARWEARLNGECAWIDAWVELENPAEVTSYREFLQSYASEQQRLGRFAWPPNVRLRNLMAWLDYLDVTPRASNLSMLISASFLIIVLVNVVGLMLARFMRRAPEIGVRRALGASRVTIYWQFLVEGAVMGLVGGLAGTALTILGVWAASALFAPKIARLVHVDASLIALTVLVAVIATLVSALYPTWRAAQTQPAWQIKINS